MAMDRKHDADARDHEPSDTGEDPGRRFGNEVDDESADSFPASDAPSFTPVTSIAPPDEDAAEREEHRDKDEPERRAG